MQDATLALRDIHSPPPPPWWPPAPGWWLLAALLAIAVALASAIWLHRRRRRRAIARLFDDAMAAATSPAEQVARMSELLRRAGRRRDASADRLQGEAWLRFLDGDPKLPALGANLGQLLLEGGFRRDVSSADAEALRLPVRARFLKWMGAAR